MDFTLITYKSFLEELITSGYSFILFKDFIKLRSINNSYAFLRHDVDRLPYNSLRTAEIEHKLGIIGSYYFRIVPESFKVNIIQKIAALGHEIGYHYEDVDLVLKKQKLKVKNQKDEDDLIALAYESFCKNLVKFRKIIDVKTICMHGSPLSKYDNKMIWRKYNYKDLGIIAEPYLDLDWNEWGYLTDTGRDGMEVT